MPRVAAGRFNVTSVTPVERLQITRQMLELRPWRRREKPRIDERVAFATKLRGEARMGTRRRGESLRQREMLVRDRCKLTPRGFGDGGQTRARALRLFAPRTLIARKRIVADDSAVDNSFLHGGAQSVARNGGLELERSVDEFGRRLFEARKRVLQLKAHQSNDACARRRVGRLARVKERERHAIAVVDQGGVADQTRTVALDRQRFGQIAEVPRADAFLFASVADRRNRKLRRFAKLRARCMT